MVSATKFEVSALARREAICVVIDGADGGTRTRTAFQPRDFKSLVSTGSTTSARVYRPKAIC